MRIITYNVNGVRASLKKGLVEWMQASQPDVLCLQEIKAIAEQVDTTLFEAIGYHHYWFSAQKKGYSGVAILCKQKPLHVAYGCGIPDMDAEGRIIRVDFEKFSVMSLYIPSGTNMDRLGYKLDFCTKLLAYIKDLKKTIPNLIICGDYNICHEAIDIHNPLVSAKVSGFLPIEREWLTSFMTDCEMIDSFRYYVKEPHHYSWWSNRANARNNNKGWRIDYNMVSKSLTKNMQRTVILPEARHSDHCPVVLELGF